MKKINLIIPAAGAATRLRPLSKNTSKVMVRINGKPTLDYILESVKESAIIENLIIVAGAFPDIEDYCEIKHPDATIVYQKDLSGPYNAISLGMEEVDDRYPVVVWLGDTIVLDENLPLGEDFLLCKEVVNQKDWCMWNPNLRTFTNKPEVNIKDSLALVGVYSFSDSTTAKTCFTGGYGAYDISEGLKLYYDVFDAVLTTQWYDIGELKSYYKTCGELLKLKSRAFNDISYDSDLSLITKTCNPDNEFAAKTISNESNWYNQLNSPQTCFVPQIHKATDTEIVMSHEAGVLLSDMMLYDNLPESSWLYLIQRLCAIKQDYFSTDVESDECIDFDTDKHLIWWTKSIERLKETCFDNKYRRILESIALSIESVVTPISVMHGDLHGGNIIYNDQTDSFKFIDPRGEYGSSRGEYGSGIDAGGDNLYDWCKLSHDLYHGYSAMVADVEPNPLVKKLFLEEITRLGLPVGEIIAGGLLLLATCIPLHNDDKNRQNRFAAYVENYLDENYML